MKSQSERIKQMRLERSWTQEELATATGLNLRTIQRIEKGGKASLQSRKAFAAVFDTPLEELADVAYTGKSFEYKTLEIDSNEGFLSGLKKSEPIDLAQLLNDEGQEGWALIQILRPDAHLGVWSGKGGHYVAVFQRELMS